jgi:hypothetical protein
MSSNVPVYPNLSLILVGGLAYLLGRNSTSASQGSQSDDATQTNYLFNKDGLLEKILFDPYKSQNEAEKVIRLFDHRLMIIACSVLVKTGFYNKNKRFYIKKTLEAFNQYIFGDFIPNSEEYGLVRVSNFITPPATRGCTLKVNSYSQSNSWLNFDNTTAQLGDLSLGRVELNLPARSGRNSSLRMNVILDVLRLVYYNISDIAYDKADDREAVLDLLNASIESLVNDQTLVKPELVDLINHSMETLVAYLGYDSKNLIIRYERKQQFAKFTTFKKAVYKALNLDSY